MAVLTSGIDELIERNHRILNFESVKPRDVLNLQNWVRGNGCIAREETAYVERGKELLSIAIPDDNVVTWLEALVEDISVRLRVWLGKAGNSNSVLLPDRED